MSVIWKYLIPLIVLLNVGVYVWRHIEIDGVRNAQLLHLQAIFTIQFIMLIGSTILYRRIRCLVKNLVLSKIGCVIRFATIFLIGMAHFAWLCFYINLPDNSILAMISFSCISIHAHSVIFLLMLIGIEILTDFFFPTKALLLFKSRSLHTISALAIGFTFTIAGLIVTMRLPLIRHENIYIEKLAPELDGFSIGLITDVHIGPTVSKKRVDTIVDLLNDMNVSTIAISGDLIDGFFDNLKQRAEPLRRLKSRYGTFYVTGNHEYYHSDVNEWVDFFRIKLNIKILHNECEIINVSSNNASICMVGVDDLITELLFVKGHKMDADKALKNCPQESTIVLLAHQPNAARKIIDTTRRKIDLILSGHTHGGGQLYIFYPLAYYVNAFLHGLYRDSASGSQIFVSSGVNYWGPPVKIWDRCEIVHLRLRLDIVLNWVLMGEISIDCDNKSIITSDDCGEFSKLIDLNCDTQILNANYEYFNYNLSLYSNVCISDNSCRCYFQKSWKRRNMTDGTNDDNNFRRKTNLLINLKQQTGCIQCIRNKQKASFYLYNCNWNKYKDNDKKINVTNWILQNTYHKSKISLISLLIHIVCALLFVTTFIGHSYVMAWSQQHLEDDPLGGATANTSIISQVLNRLTDRSKYDKRLRPRYGEGSVDVGITIHVSSISAVSEVDMDFTLDFYLRQTWHDPRLAFGKLDLHGFESIKSLTVGVDYLDRLWKPDTFFPNEKKSFFHTATTHNSFLRIEPDGRVYTSQRLTVTATCPMELRLFPMDSQACKLEIESYGYTTADISYYWGERKAENRAPEEAVAFGAFTLPQFRRTGFRVNITNAVTSSGVYDRLYIEVILARNLGFYLMNIIIPSMLIVSISWVSFWLSREASPARVGLGVTTVLTMTTLITTTNNSMPKVSYIKGLDVFLNFCFVMVFASLVEYAVVSYWNKRQCRLRERRRKRGLTSMGGAGANEFPTNGMQLEMPMFTNYPTTPAGGLAVSPPAPVLASASSGTQNSYIYRAPGLLIPTATSSSQSPQHSIENNFKTIGSSSPAFMNIPPDCDCRTIPLMQYNDTMNLYHNQQIPPGATMYSGTTPTIQRRRGGWRLGGGGGGGGIHSNYNDGITSNWCCRRFSPSKIDRCSRSMFPLLFIGFNFLYWSVMTFLSQWNMNRQSFVAFHDE